MNLDIPSAAAVEKLRIIAAYYNAVYMAARNLEQAQMWLERYVESLLRGRSEKWLFRMWCLSYSSYLEYSLTANVLEGQVEWD